MTLWFHQKTKILKEESKPSKGKKKKKFNDYYSILSK